MDRNGLGFRYHRDDVVALRKESVDRNFHRAVNIQRPTASLSARRAWIEIATSLLVYLALIRRSPQGERG